MAISRAQWRSHTERGTFSLYLVQTHTDCRGASGEEQAWEERLHARRKERKRETTIAIAASASHPLWLARSLAALSVDLGAFHAETVGKGGERGREGRRDAVVVVGESRSLRALALEKAATALALQEEIWFSHRCIQGARTPQSSMKGWTEITPN